MAAGGGALRGERRGLASRFAPPPAASRVAAGKPPPGAPPGLRFSHERPGHHRRHAREGSSFPRLAPRSGLRLRRLLRRRRFGLHRLRRGRRARRRPRARHYRPQCELSGHPLHPAEVGAEIDRSPSGTPEFWHAGRWPSYVSGLSPDRDGYYDPGQWFRTTRTAFTAAGNHCNRMRLQPHAGARATTAGGGGGAGFFRGLLPRTLQLRRAIRKFSVAARGSCSPTFVPVGWLMVNAPAER